MWQSIIPITLCTCAIALGGVIKDSGPEMHQFDDYQPPKQQHKFQPSYGGGHDESPALYMQDQHHEAAPADTHHDHKVEHKHAISHQSFKIHHFHPVPVYVKKDKHPIEIGGVKHKLKQVHPETEKHHGYGLVLENHTDHKHHEVLTDEHHHLQHQHQPQHSTPNEHKFEPEHHVEHQHEPFDYHQYANHQPSYNSPIIEDIAHAGGNHPQHSPQFDEQPYHEPYRQQQHQHDYADDQHQHYHDINTRPTY